MGWLFYAWFRQTWKGSIMRCSNSHWAANFCLNGSALFRNRVGNLYKLDATLLRWQLCSKLTWRLYQTFYVKLFLVSGKTYHTITRNKDQFNVPKCRLDVYKKSFAPNAVINQWNSLNADARTANSINLFRKHMPNVTKPPKYYYFFFL